MRLCCGARSACGRSSAELRVEEDDAAATSFSSLLVRSATAFVAVVFTTALLRDAVFSTATFFTDLFFAAVFGASVFFGAAFLAPVFWPAAFLLAAFLRAAFFGAACFRAVLLLPAAFFFAAGLVAGRFFAAASFVGAFFRAVAFFFAAVFFFAADFFGAGFFATALARAVNVVVLFVGPWRFASGRPVARGAPCRRERIQVSQDGAKPPRSRLFAPRSSSE